MRSKEAAPFLATHMRMRASGFGVVSVISGRTPLDARIWLAEWCKAFSVCLIIAPSTVMSEILAAYTTRLEPANLLGVLRSSKLPILLVPGELDQSLEVADRISQEHSHIPIAVTCGLPALTRTLLNPETPMHLVSTALKGLIPVEEEEGEVLKLIAEKRQVSPFLRGACEGIVYYMLKARPETRGRFESNKTIRRADGKKRHEVDLVCEEAKLVIEIDGPEHNRSRSRIGDSQKQADLEALGYCVRRFANQQVIEDPVGVWQLIQEQLNRKTALKENHK